MRDRIPRSWRDAYGRTPEARMLDYWRRQESALTRPSRGTEGGQDNG